MKDEKLQRIPIQFEIVNKIDDRFTFVKIYLMHLGLNLNGSVFTKDVVEKCWGSLALTPILGYIQVDENDNVDFDGHKNILVVKNGEYELKYIGQAFGCIGENCNPRWEKKIDPYGTEKEYLVCDGVLWSGKYSDVKEIIDRDISKKESMELDQNFSGYYDDNQNFVFTNFKFYGACMLSDKKNEAMTGACVEKVFSYEDFKEEIQSQMESLKLTLTQLELNQQAKLNVDPTNINQSHFQTEGGTNTLEEKLQLITKYSNLTDEDLKDIKEKLEDYSLEDLEKDLKDLSDKKFYEVITQENVELKAKNAEFSVTIEELNIKITSLESASQDLQSKFSALETEKVELQTKFEKIQSQYSALETEKQTLETEKADFEAKCTAFETENNELKSFKEKTLTTKRKEAEDVLFEMFSEKLTEDELKPVKDIAMNFSLEQLEEKLWLLAAKKTIKFEHNAVKPKVDFTFEKDDSITHSEKPYADIVSQYVSK